MNQRGIVIRQEEKAFHLLAKRANLAIEVHEDLCQPWPRTLYLDPAVHVPWELLPRGMDFLDNWEAAAPVWSYETLVADLATGRDRKRTEALIGDLRVPMYAHELLFVRDCEGGRALLAAWQDEIAAVPGGDARIAFVRALYQVKPLFLALPRSWLTTAKETHKAVGRAVVAAPTPASAPIAKPKPRKRYVSAQGLVRVQVAPNRFVSCKPGDEEKVKQEWLVAHMPRRERRANARKDSG